MICNLPPLKSGGRSLRVRGAAKVMAHLMFGVLVIAALEIGQRLS